eukprot:495860-Amphidinium_carterae.1
MGCSHASGAGSRRAPLASGQAARVNKKWINCLFLHLGSKSAYSSVAPLGINFVRTVATMKQIHGTIPGGG